MQPGVWHHSSAALHQHLHKCNGQLPNHSQLLAQELSSMGSTAMQPSKGHCRRLFHSSEQI